MFALIFFYTKFHRSFELKENVLFFIIIIFNLLQILSLGAGFDSLYFRLHSDGALNCATIFEVDFPDVTQRKAALIKSNVILMEMLDFDVHSPTGQ